MHRCEQTAVHAAFSPKMVLAEECSQITAMPVSSYDYFILRASNHLTRIVHAKHLIVAARGKLDKVRKECMTSDWANNSQFSVSSPLQHRQSPWSSWPMTDHLQSWHCHSPWSCCVVPESLTVILSGWVCAHNNLLYYTITFLSSFFIISSSTSQKNKKTKNVLGYNSLDSVYAKHLWQLGIIKLQNGSEIIRNDLNI